MEIILFFTLLLLILIPLLLRSRRASDRLPPGSLGIPLLGQSLGLLKALRENKDEEWFRERIRKYGPISKLTLFGYPTVFISGQAAIKFIFTSDGKTLSNKQPSSVGRLLGKKNIAELTGEDHKRLRAAILSFLKPEVLKKCYAKVDEEIRNHLNTHWHGKHQVKVMPLMKTLTFNINCSIIFGLEEGRRRDQLLSVFEDMIQGLLSLPINLPFTQFHRSIRARERLEVLIMDLISEKRVALENHRAHPHQDLITSMLSIQKDDKANAMSDEEILDNVLTVMFAGYDTTSILLSFLVKLLAENSTVYSAVVEEQENIANNKAAGEPLTWDDLTKMKYTWRVATEALRVTPPVFGTFRRVLKDIEYGGYTIPKGWQVIFVQSMTHMDSTLFPDPSKFDPTRFEQQTPTPPYSFIAFGGGPRMCPGYDTAKMETLAMIHYLVTRFTWKLSSKDNSFKREPMPVFKNGLPIQVVPKI